MNYNESIKDIIMNTINIKKWFILVGVATALLVIPRRSSKKADIRHSNKPIVNTDYKNDGSKKSK